MLESGGHRRLSRFIPARAGNTRPRKRRAGRTTVHPRSRGEHFYDPARIAGLDGSSPLARGTHGRTRSSTTWDTVHPRSRGEHPPVPCARMATTGSSPLARGTLRDHPAAASVRRFIPARAGNTTHRHSWSWSEPVHPRSRGEHVLAVLAEPLLGGSSPLARGTLHRVLHCRPQLRFIPARAGNTPSRLALPATAPVHPRSRGEHARRHAFDAPDHGSSPLARGTRCPPPCTTLRSRFIPARAGNTRGMAGRSSRHSVHPRSRGEH